MISESDWRWPPDNSSAACVQPVLQPEAEGRKTVPVTGEPLGIEAAAKTQFLPRSSASSMFSATVIEAAVPFIGSWKTRATRLARLCTGKAVTSSPLMRIFPESSISAPEMAFSMLLLPAPFEPMTMAKLPVRQRQAEVVEGDLLVGLALVETFRADQFPSIRSSFEPFRQRRDARLADGTA